MIRLRCEYCQQTIADGGSAADQKTAYYEHRAACKPQHKAHQLFKGETMNDDRDARIEAIMRRYEAGEISYAVAQELTLFSDEAVDDYRRRRDNIG